MIKYKVINGITPSPIERKICRILKANKIKFFREVQFEQCKNQKTGMPLRYDFYLPERNILIEYDGKKYHQAEDVIERDNYKTDFAISNGICIHRAKSWQGMQSIFILLGIEVNIKKKTNQEYISGELYRILGILKTDKEGFYNELIKVINSGNRVLYRKLRQRVGAMNLYGKKMRRSIEDHKDEFLSQL